MNDEDLIQVSFLSYGQEVDKKLIIRCLMKDQRVKYLNGVFRKLIILIFLGLKIFFQIFLKKILTIVLTCWKKFWIFMIKKELKIFGKFLRRVNL